MGRKLSKIASMISKDSVNAKPDFGQPIPQSKMDYIKLLTFP